MEIKAGLPMFDPLDTYHIHLGPIKKTQEDASNGPILLTPLSFFSF